MQNEFRCVTLLGDGAEGWARLVPCALCLRVPRRAAARAARRPPRGRGGLSSAVDVWRMSMDVIRFQTMLGHLQGCQQRASAPCGPLHACTSSRGPACAHALPDGRGRSDGDASALSAQGRPEPSSFRPELGWLPSILPEWRWHRLWRPSPSQNERQALPPARPPGRGCR